MRKENLPEKRRTDIFYKIKMWFFNLRKKNDNCVECTEEKKTTIDPRKNKFIEEIKCKTNDRLLYLQKELKSNKIKISELTDKELDDLIELYELQIKEKREILKGYKAKLDTLN